MPHTLTEPVPRLDPDAALAVLVEFPDGDWETLTDAHTWYDAIETARLGTGRSVQDARIYRAVLRAPEETPSEEDRPWRD